MSDKHPQESPGPRVPLPWSRSCYVCGQDNPDGLRARSFKSGELVELALRTERRFAGWSDVIHGGLIATVLDEVMTWASIVESQKPCYAAEFTLRMLKPLRPETDCVARARVSQARRRIIETEAWLEDDEGVVYARASGRYMPVPEAQLAGLRDDFVTAPGCLDLGPVFGL